MLACLKKNIAFLMILSRSSETLIQYVNLDVSGDDFSAFRLIYAKDSSENILLAGKYSTDYWQLLMII